MCFAELRSYGAQTSVPLYSLFQLFQEVFSDPVNSADSRAQYLLAADFARCFVALGFCRRFTYCG